MGFVLFIHVTVCVLLVVVILMQAGRGGGLTETFSSAESMFGTQTNSFMVKVTSALAVVFLFTSLFLAVHSSNAERSLMTHAKLPKAAEASQEPATVKVGTPQPVNAPAPQAKAASSPAAKPASPQPVTNAAQ